MFLSGGTRISSIPKAYFVVKPPKVSRNSIKLLIGCALFVGPFSEIPKKAAIDVDAA